MCSLKFWEFVLERSCNFKFNLRDVIDKTATIGDFVWPVTSFLKAVDAIEVFSITMDWYLNPFLKLTVFFDGYVGVIDYY